MKGNRAVLLPFLLLSLTGATWSKRHSRRQSPTLEEWQQRYLEKLQVLAREGGLPEEEWKAITKFDKDVCYEKSCLDSALEFMTAVNFTVDPCNKNTWLDFACSRRVNGNDNINQVERLMMNTDGQTIDILEASTETGSLKNEFLLKEAQTYYFQCKNKARDDKEDIKGIYKFLSESYGNWPIFTNRPPNEKFDWSDMVADLNRMERFGFTPLIFQVLIPTSGSHIVMGLGQTSFSSVNMADFVAFFKGIHKNAQLKKPFRQEQINDMLMFLNKLSAVSIQQSSAVKATVAQLQKRTDEIFAEKDLQSNINFEKFFKQIFANTDVSISPETEVLLPFDTVLAVLDHLAMSDQRAVSNALNFQYAGLLLQESTTLLDDLNTFKCTEEPGAREQLCLERTKEIFGYSLGKTFLKVYLDEPAITPIVSDLMKKIQKGYINVVLGYDWMANSTKAYLKDKIESMRTFITQPDWLREKNALENFYEELNASADKESPYPLNFMNVNQWYLAKKRNWQRFKATITSLENLEIYHMQWSRYLGTVQATFLKSINQVRVEGGLLQTPAFVANSPGFMNFGGLGTVLAHEIGHSFDQQGRKFNKNGVAGEFWDNESVLMYLKWINGIADRYGKEAHQISETSAETVSGAQTLDEDIADIMGVHIGFLSYLEYLKELEAAGKREKVLPGLKSFAPQKLFYMKYANMWCDNKDVQDVYTVLLTDEHSAGNTRATMPLMLSNQFAQTFGCKAR